MDPRGKFIVIEGTDGSGKTVQFERLVLALPEGTKLGTLDFRSTANRPLISSRNTSPENMEGRWGRTRHRSCMPLTVLMRS